MKTKKDVCNDLIKKFDQIEDIETEDQPASDIESEDNKVTEKTFKFEENNIFKRGHKNCATCIDAKFTDSGPKCVTGGKDCTIHSWDLEHLRITTSLSGFRNDYLKPGFPTGSITSVLVTNNSIYAGCNDGNIIIWDEREAKSNNFIAHKGYVTGLCYCETPSYELVENVDIYGNGTASNSDNYIYSSGSDGVIFKWDLRYTNVHLNESKGHVGAINQMVSLGQNKLLTTGSDLTTRLWNMNSNTHHIYNGGGECCTLIGKKSFASGDDAGNVYLFSSDKKSAIKKINAGTWVSAITLYANKLICGICEGDRSHIGICDLGVEDSKIDLGDIIKYKEVSGIINGISVLGNIAVSVIGTNHKYGRWFKERRKNGILVTTL